MINLKVNPSFKTALITLLISAAVFTSCKKNETPVVEEPNVPEYYADRPVNVQGTVEVDSRKVVFNVWDSGQIDGDIITLVVNGKKVISNYTLTGTKKSIPVTLDNTGYNYVLLYAHNEGSLSPNTAALSIEDNTGEKNLVLSANLTSNAAYNVVVN
ncbi:hypothetical protein NF867_18210 [Solitalea sp. MAHUQ-68]|uniref:Uncharacterized protein n=1 Tax=Solitalea agri TaxID=2953739 RepID=A0A9X2JE45_9SPHI|nr:hypothetical protein [Solitalea agri]MCO4294803.1 hypothetical protein [Solitalea agri]